ncbi:MAG: hypothetical protein E7675_01335 [Ruminococcaceae bacterium]|nr:hypothetical protein [Oscillospiraceae bacterium]
MNIKVVKMPYEKVISLPKPKHQKPKKPWFAIATLVRMLSQIDAWQTKFSYTCKGENSIPDEPCMILMNHSSFIDLKLASRILYPKKYQIVCAADAMVGLDWILRPLGCIPTQKFVNDMTLIRDIKYALNQNKASVLMYPEAGYTFDGKCVTLPEKFGSLFKLLGVPVVMITTRGAFARNPLYNGIKNRNVKVSAEVECILTKEDVKNKTVEEIDEKIKQAFSFDNFAWQFENNVKIKEDFRADGLGNLLYKCTECLTEGEMIGESTSLYCKHCGKKYTLNELGRLESENGDVKFPHVPDWYDWQRKSAEDEVNDGTYGFDENVKINMMVDYKAIYDIGNGRLVHNEDGFKLYLEDGTMIYEQKPLFAHSICVDLHWYEKGDAVCIGDKNGLFYCMLDKGYKVTKTRFAVEALYSKLRPRVKS